MKSLWIRLLSSATLGAIALVLLAGASKPTTVSKQPDKLVILSTADVKGKTSPCG